MIEEKDKMISEVKEKIESLDNLREVNDLKVLYLGKKGPVNDLTSKLKDLPVEEKKSFGMMLNELKTELNNIFDIKINELETRT